MTIHIDINIVAGIFVVLTKGVFLMKILIETSDFTVWPFRFHVCVIDISIISESQIHLPNFGGQQRVLFRSLLDRVQKIATNFRNRKRVSFSSTNQRILAFSRNRKHPHQQYPKSARKIPYRRNRTRSLFVDQLLGWNPECCCAGALLQAEHWASKKWFPSERQAWGARSEIPVCLHRHGHWKLWVSGSTATWRIGLQKWLLEDGWLFWAPRSRSLWAERWNASTSRWVHPECYGLAQVPDQDPGWCSICSQIVFQIGT